MADVPLYDLAPIARIMALGVVVALGPLAWVWLRSQRQPPARRLAALTLLTLFITFDLVLFGAFTRLTDSGLGCPDWPGCYGEFTPLGAHKEISAAQTAMPTGPVTPAKAWIEMIHRYMATGVGVLILTLAVASGWRRRELPVSPAWPLFTLVWVCLQGAFGALTVTMKLTPAIVTLHLLGGLVLLALLCRQAVTWSQVQGSPVARGVSPALRKGLIAGFLLLWLQVALGGWVSTNYAVLACMEFPTCQGSHLPAMDFVQGFTLWRPLGLQPEGQPITFAALTAIHMVHRWMAGVLVLVIALVLWQLRAYPALRRPMQLLGMLLALQLATGLSNVVLGWPLLAAVLHTGGAGAMLACIVWLLTVSRMPVHSPVAMPTTLRQAT